MKNMYIIVDNFDLLYYLLFSYNINRYGFFQNVYFGTHTRTYAQRIALAENKIIPLLIKSDFRYNITRKLFSFLDALVNSIYFIFNLY